MATSAPRLGFLDGGGEAARHILDRDWSGHPLGPPEGWPDALKVSLSLVLNSPQSMALAWGREPLFLFFNETYFPLLGPRLEWAMGSRFQDVWADGWSQAEPIIREAFAGRGASYVDEPWRLDTDRGAQDTWFTFSYSRILDPAGDIGGLFILTQETTDHVLANRSAAAVQARKRAMLQQMPGFAAILHGPTHVYDYVNDAYQRISGGREFIGRTVREVFPDLEGQGFHDPLDSVFDTGERYAAKAVPVTLQGEPEPLFIDLLYEPIRDPDGRITGIFVGGYDVTDAHRTLSALRESEAELRYLNADLESRVTEQALARGRTWYLSPELLGVVNTQGYFETSNPAWRTTLGWSEREVAETPFLQFIHPDDLEVTEQAWKAAMEEAKPAFRFENRHRHKSGGWRWLSWVAVPEDGKVYCSARDITDEKAAQVELVKTQEALRQAQKMEAVGQLTGGIAHDFNNLLAGIGGSLELLQERMRSGRTADLERYVEDAQASSRRATALTQRLLAFSRRQTLDPHPTGVNRLIDGMENLIQRSIGPTITLEVLRGQDLWTTFIEAPQLENALLNLCINARDAMPDGGRVTIETANRTLDARTARAYDLTPGDFVAICVTDTGLGMTPEVAARAFDPFFTTKPLGQGTGLGLSMIYGFVRQSGGQVRIHSQEGRGTSLCLYLPRYLGEAEEPFSGADEVVPVRGAGTVLVVDDEQIIRRLIVEVLQDGGYQTLEAKDGPSALLRLDEADHIDLLITDVGLPGGMNGRQIADEARRQRPRLKVLFVTGYAETSVVGNGRLDPGMAVLTKPFVMNDLRLKIAEMVEPHSD